VTLEFVLHGLLEGLHERGFDHLRHDYRPIPGELLLDRLLHVEGG
jgi:hypothetical protein